MITSADQDRIKELERETENRKRAVKNYLAENLRLEEELEGYQEMIKKIKLEIQNHRDTSDNIAHIDRWIKEFEGDE